MSINEGRQYRRSVTPIFDEVSAIGGLFYPFLFLGIGLSMLFIDPFRKLELA
jgi:hypothetical protein